MKTTRRNNMSFTFQFLCTCACLWFVIVTGGCFGCEAPEVKPVPPPPSLGIEISDITAELANSLGLKPPHGVMIAGVLAGSPAEAAGLKANDILLRWNKETIPNAAALQWMVLASQEGGPPVEIDLLRQGKEQTVQITLRERPAVGSSNRTQADIESDFLRANAQVERGEAKPTDVFGDTDRWTLQVGPHRIFLDPFSRQWLYYDTLHGTWESTGFGIGEANFALFRGKLAAKRIATGKP